MAEIVLPEKLTVRGAVAAVQIAAIQVLETAVAKLLESAGITDTIDIDDVTVNINFRDRRIDIAKLTPDGNHIDHWICGFSIDPEDLSAFGTPVGLPGFSDPTGKTH